MEKLPRQDKHAYVEILKSAAAAEAEADIEGMDLQDTLCLAILSGVKDAHLREKLSELKRPSLSAFCVLIDLHMHAKVFQVALLQQLLSMPQAIHGKKRRQQK